MSLPHRSFPFLLLAALLLSASAGHAASSPSKKSGPNIYLTGAGLLLLAGGGAFAYYQNREADKDMKTYRGSAFTGNTEAYRDKVREHERYAWAGLAGAALGGILIVVSF